MRAFQMDKVLMNKMTENAQLLTFSELIHRVDFELRQIQDKRPNPFRTELMYALKNEMRRRILGFSTAKDKMKAVTMISSITQIEDWIKSHDTAQA